MKPSLKGRVLAIVAGCAFAAGGLTILLDKDLTKPLEWAASQWLTILTVFGTIAAGHLMADAGRARHVFATLGFLALFLSGTGLVVYNSVGRQVETAGTSMLSAEDTNKKIVETTADLEAAKQRKAYADGQVQKEMTHSFCGRNCKDWQQNGKDVGVVIGQLEAEITALGPRKPVNAQAEAMADIAIMLHVPASKPQIVAALMLLVPFFKTLFFEIGSIVSLGFAFRQRPLTIARPANDTRAIGLFDSRRRAAGAESNDFRPPPGGGRKSRKRLPSAEIVRLRPANHPVVAALEANGGSVASNRQLAKLMSVSEGEASKRWPEVEDRLIVTRHGKRVGIALRT